MAHVIWLGSGAAALYKRAMIHYTTAESSCCEWQRQRRRNEYGRAGARGAEVVSFHLERDLLKFLGF